MSVILSIVCLFIGYKIWQRSIMELSTPQLESLASISAFSAANVKGDVVLVVKDSISFDEVQN